MIGDLNLSRQQQKNPEKLPNSLKYLAMECFV